MSLKTVLDAAQDLERHRQRLDELTEKRRTLQAELDATAASIVKVRADAGDALARLKAEITTVASI